MAKENIEVSQYNTVDDNIPGGFDGYTIVLISDLHNELFGQNQCELIDGDIIYKGSHAGDVFIEKIKKQDSDALETIRENIFDMRDIDELNKY